MSFRRFEETNNNRAESDRGMPASETKIQQRERELYDPAECNYTVPDNISCDKRAVSRSMRANSRFINRQAGSALRQREPEFKGERHDAASSGERIENRKSAGSLAPFFLQALEDERTSRRLIAQCDLCSQERLRDVPLRRHAFLFRSPAAFPFYTIVMLVWEEFRKNFDNPEQSRDPRLSKTRGVIRIADQRASKRRHIRGDANGVRFKSRRSAKSEKPDGKHASGIPRGESHTVVETAKQRGTTTWREPTC